MKLRHLVTAVILEQYKALNILGQVISLKEVKTVICPIEDVERFDIVINKLLKENWILKKREVIKTRSVIADSFNASFIQALYAELEK